MRLLVYDGHASVDPAQQALRSAWAAGARLYAALGHIDAHHGATSWGEALAWVTTYRCNEPIAELQYWGHGRWGRVLVARDALEASSLRSRGAHRTQLDAIRHRMLPDGASLVWLRTCEAFGARVGQDFASGLADRLGARVAGHTHRIGALQSGLRGLMPGRRPYWSADEGIREGSAEDPRQGASSSFAAPNTTHFLRSKVPDEWFAG